MELFSKIQSLLSEDATITITVRKNPDGILSVCTAFTGHKSTDGLAPFMLRGSAEEIDKAYVDELSKPLQTVTTLITNAKEFEKSAAAAAKAATTKPATGSSDATKKYEEQRKAAEAKKANGEKLLADAKTANDKGLFNTAVALYEKGKEFIDDIKKKKDIDGLIARAKEGINSFFCSDNEDDAKKAVAEFENSLSQKQEKETPAPVAEPKDTPTDTPKETNDNETENENEDETTVDE